MKKLIALMAVVAMAVGAEAASTFYWSFQDATSKDYVRDGTSTGTVKSGTAYLFYATSFTSGGARQSVPREKVNLGLKK